MMSSRSAPEMRSIPKMLPLVIVGATRRRLSSAGRRLIRLMCQSASSFLQGETQGHGQDRLHHSELFVGHVGLVARQLAQGRPAMRGNPEEVPEVSVEPVHQSAFARDEDLCDLPG